MSFRSKNLPTLTPEVAEYSREKLTSKVEKLEGWSLINEDDIEKLYKEYVFSDFIEAFGFISQVALISQTMNHHAEIYNVYKKVEIRLCTHSAGAVTSLDTTFAANLENL